MSTVRQFPLRLDEPTYEMLSFLAKRTGKTMSHLVRQAIDSQLRIAATELEHDLRTTLKQLEQYTRSREHLEADLNAFAVAEVEHHDPVEATRVQFGAEDPAATGEHAGELESEVEAILGGS